MPPKQRHKQRPQRSTKRRQERRHSFGERKEERRIIRGGGGGGLERTPRRSRDRVKIIARLFKHLNGHQEEPRRGVGVAAAARVLLSFVCVCVHHTLTYCIAIHHHPALALDSFILALLHSFCATLLYARSLLFLLLLFYLVNEYVCLWIKHRAQREGPALYRCESSC